jgi:signal recognition particle subunit SRP54
MGNAVKDAEIDEKSFKHIEAVIQSMTAEERAAPHIINGNRKKRIAVGSGTNIQEVNRLLKQFEDMNKMMKMMNNKHAMAGMMKAMGKMPFGK